MVRQFAYMIYSHFKSSDVQGAVLEARDLLRIELKVCNLRVVVTH